MGSNHGPTRMALAEATTQELIRDVQLAVEANLDLLRIHAHVTRLELYDAADAAGLLLWQDLPLQWGYARGTRKEAVRQAREMVDLLGHHPSIALWCAHNEPLAIDLQPGERVPRPRRGADRRVDVPADVEQGRARSLGRARAPQGRPDPHGEPALRRAPRPRRAAGTDTHFYFGWYHGRMDGLAAALRAMPRLARFVTEFGAQAVPTPPTSCTRSAGPTSTGTTSSSTTRCRSCYFDQHVPPALFDSFGAWRDATQHYQAALIQLQVEDLRRLKHDPTGGFCQFCFADGHPAVTWSVLDHARKPKTGYYALRDACRSVLPMLEPRDGLVHVVSELRDRAPRRSRRGRRRRAPPRWTGDVPADGITYIGGLDVPPDDARHVTLTLRHPERSAR